MKPRKSTSTWLSRTLQRLVRRNYVRWATLIARYPFSLIFVSVVFTLICCLSFYIKTPYSIHAFSPDKLVENHPEGHILQFEFENERPTYKLIEETTNAIKNHENLSKNCVRGESLKSGIPPELSKVIPSHSCLIFSPANIQKDGNVDELFKRHKKAARLLWGAEWKHFPPVVTALLRHDIDPRAPWLLTLTRDLFGHTANAQVPRSVKEPLININFHYGYPSAIDWLVYLSAGVLLYAYYYVTVRKMNFLDSSIITSAAVCGTLIMSLIVALGCCVALDLDIYVESGPFERGIGWIFIYYGFTFIAFESILMMTQCVIETPVEGNSFFIVLEIRELEKSLRVWPRSKIVYETAFEEGPTERIAHGLLRGGSHLSKFFFAQLALTTIGSISEYSRSFSIFALIMVLSHSALLHSFFAPILFLELKQLERSEPTWIHESSGAAMRLRRYWNSRNSRKLRDDTLEDVTPLVDLGENHIDPMEGVLKPLRIRLLQSWAHKAIIQKIMMILFVSWVCYRVFVNPNDDENYSGYKSDGNFEFAKLPWAYAFQLYSRDIRGKHLTFLPRVRVPFQPNGSRPVDPFQNAAHFKISRSFNLSWRLIALFVAFAVAIFKMHQAYARKSKINKTFVEYFGSGKTPFDDLKLQKRVELNLTIEHIAHDHKTGCFLLVDVSGSISVYDPKTDKIVAQSSAKPAQYLPCHIPETVGFNINLERLKFPRQKSFELPDNSFISDDETIWSVGIHQNAIILGLSSGIVKILQISNNKEVLLSASYLLDRSGVSFIITRDEESAFIAISIEGSIRKFTLMPELTAQEVQLSTPGVTVVRAMGERIVSGSLNGTVTVLNEDCKTDHVCRGHKMPVTALNLFKNGKSSSDITAMSADQSGEVRIWTLLSGRCQFVLRNYAGMISNVWPLKDILVALTQSGRVLIWTHRSGHFKQSFKVGDSSNGGGIMLDCYQNNDLLIAAFDQKIGFIDLDLKNKKKISIAQEMSIRESNFKIRSTAMTPSRLFLQKSQTDTNRSKTVFFSHGRTLKSFELARDINSSKSS